MELETPVELQVNLLKNEAIKLATAGDFEKSAGLLKHALKLMPLRHDLWYEYGKVLLSMKDLKGAKEALTRAVRLAPDVAGYWNSLGYVKYQLGEKKEALRDFERAVELDPNVWEIWVNYGTVAREVGDLERAKGALKRAYDMRPGNYRVANAYGVVLYEIGNYGEAEKVFRKALAVHREESLVFNLIITLLELGKYGEVIAECERNAHFLGGKSTWVRFYRLLAEWAIAKQNGADFRELMGIESKIIKTAESTDNKTDAAEMIFQAALTFARLGEYEKAAFCMKRARDVLNPVPRFWFEYAKVLYRLGCRKTFSEVLSVLKSMDEVLYEKLLRTLEG